MTRDATFSAYDCRLASGERASVLIVHGHGSVDMGAELVELLGAGFRNTDTARVELPAVETAVADGRGGLVWSASHGAATTNETGCTVSVSRITGDVVCQEPGEECDCLIVAAKPAAFGIPYAEQEVKGGRLFSVCPACGEWVAEDADEYGEPTNHYAEHWAEAGHTDEDVYGPKAAS